MRHYFINTEHSESDYFEFSENFLGNNYTFKSCSDVFSKNKIDEGTKVLLETVLENLQLKGNVLDLGCGYGVIGIVLKKHFPNTFITMVDINKTAVNLSKENIKKNGLPESQFKVVESNLLENVKDKFNHVVTNPPIKVGKEILFSAITESYNALLNNGTITLVIRKDHGQESLKNHLITLFGNCEVLKRHKGYYILHSIKKAD